MDFPPDEYDDTDLYPRGVYVTRYRPRRGRIDHEGDEVAYRPIPAGMSRVAAVELLTVWLDANHPAPGPQLVREPAQVPRVALAPVLGFARTREERELSMTALDYVLYRQRRAPPAPRT
jgi:hypothetical protein